MRRDKHDVLEVLVVKTRRGYQGIGYLFETISFTEGGEEEIVAKHD